MDTNRSAGHIKSLVKRAKKARKNRVFYENNFRFDDLYRSGIIQSESKTAFDRVTLDRGEYEAVSLFGFDSNGSHFNLSLSILPLYTDYNEFDRESLWRLGSVKFLYISNGDGNNNARCEYTYENEQLIDYDEKRKCANQHEARNVYSIGSLSVENVHPFSISRILFNGLLTRKIGDRSELVSAKITISTHPASDKFDYQYGFNVDYLSEIINNSSLADQTKLGPEKLLKLVLENRVDQTFMFQGRIELLDSSNKAKKEVERFIMWGAKVKQVVDQEAALNGIFHKESLSRESLFIWSDCGHEIHLTRPAEQPSLVYGMISSGYDYSSYLYEAKLRCPDGTKSFSLLSSFAKLVSGCEILLRGYKVKEYSVKLLDEVDVSGRPFRVTINNFKGWCILSNVNLASMLREADARLHVLDISNEQTTFKLSSEKLLGGKGNSLVELSRLVSQRSDFDLEKLTGQVARNVSVPRGAIVSCVAYQRWQNSSDLVRNSLRELDNTRRALAARSIYLNPMSDKHLTLAQSQQILRDQCQKTCSVLKTCPLPNDLRKVLRETLGRLFTDEELSDDESVPNRKLFAVRSSAVGEDSLETSAAGQMKTFLDIKGFDSICQAVVECWSSQFSVEAISYKSQNGLQTDLLMAVVIQELVQCKTAGVAATCDPMEGDKGRLEILANPGLGEGVVSGGRADTIRVSLKHLGWDNQSEHSTGNLLMKDVAECVTKVLADKASGCCLTDRQIVSLANLLIWLRRANKIKDREVEWGITSRKSSESGSVTSSSSSGSGEGDEFHIHLLQSRPLTNLNRLSSREIDHELDYGISSPLDVVSRANLGEVMPGALCPLNMTYFFSVVSSKDEKPFEPNHTKKTFSPDAFAFHGQVIAMVLTSSDVLSRFPINLKDEKKQNEIMAVRMMIGTLAETPAEEIDERDRFHNERKHPLSRVEQQNAASIFALDSGLLRMFIYATKKKTEGCILTKGLTSIDDFIGRLEQASKHDNPIEAETGKIGVLADIDREIETLFERLAVRTDYLLSGWQTHIKATLISMAFNVMCLKLLSSQKAYPDKMESSELLNDFSILMRKSGGKTESGNILNLLGELVALMSAEGKLEAAKQMNAQQLYDYLEHSSDKCAHLYREFMRKNGHRTFKEFDLGTPTWADDPSYIIKSLVSRLKSYSGASAEQELKQRAALEEDQERKTNEILDNKVDSYKSLLTGYLLPRARNAVVRREQSKSLIIKIIDKYRSAFRHLGGLLCLAGRLPSADLVFHLSIEELNTVVHLNDYQRADLARIIYKGRRRQQRQRLLNKVTFARPVISFNEMVDTVRAVSEADELGPSANNEQPALSPDPDRAQLVRGMTSCAGLVTGRACVVNSLDDMNEIQANDILITYSIDISWSVYFFTLAGIVTEIGGIVSHGAVVAREYGIPTLCNAFGACSIFKTGQIVTLNANQGVCYLASEAERAAATGGDAGGDNAGAAVAES